MSATVDIATLGLEIRSDGVVVASDRLRTLQREGSAAERAANSLSSSFSNLTRYIQATVAAMAAWKLTEYVKETALLAARVETLSVVMRVVGNNAGYTGGQMDAFAKQVQKMGITTQESMSSLIKMAGAQMDLTKASKLARVAQDAAVIGGINSSEAFGRMIQGIRSGEVEILKTIGINVNFEQSYKKLADTLGKTVADLTVTEKTSARLAAVLDFGKNIAGAYEASMGTAGKQMLSMARYTEELKLIIGELFTPALTYAVMNLVEALKSANDYLSAHRAELKVMASELANPLGVFTDLRDIIAGTVAALKELPAAAREYPGMITLIGVVAFNAMGGVAALAAAFEGLTAAIGVSMAGNPAGWITAVGISSYLAGKGIVKSLDEIGYAYAGVNLTGEAFYENEKRRAAEADKAWENVKKKAVWMYREGGIKTPLAMQDPEVKRLETAEAEKQRQQAAEKAAAAKKAAEEQAKAQEALRQEYNRGVNQYNQLVAAWEKGNGALDEVEKKLEDAAEKARLFSAEFSKHPALVKAYLSATEQLKKQIVEDDIFVQSEKAKTERLKAEGAAATQYFANRMAFYDAQEAAQAYRTDKYFKGQESRMSALRREASRTEAAFDMGLIGAEEALTKKVENLNQQLAIQEQLLAGISKGADPTAWNAQMDQIQATTIEINKLNKAMKDRTAGGGAKAAIQEYTAMAADTGRQVHDAMLNALQGIEDAFVKLATTGKLSFKSLVDSVKADAARMAARKMITEPLTGMIGSSSLFSGNEMGDFVNPVKQKMGDLTLILGTLAAAGSIVADIFFGGSGNTITKAIQETIDSLKSFKMHLEEQYFRATGNTFGADLAGLKAGQVDTLKQLWGNISKFLPAPFNREPDWTNEQSVKNAGEWVRGLMNTDWTGNLPMEWINSAKGHELINSWADTWNKQITTNGIEITNFMRDHLKEYKDFVSGLFPEPERKSRTFTEALATVTNTFNELGVTMPRTRSAMGNYIAGLDMSSVAYNKLHGIADSINIVLDAMDERTTKIAAQAQLDQDVTSRLARITGNTLGADLYDLRLKQLKEINDAEQNGMDTTQLRIVQEKEWAAAVKNASEAITEAQQKIVESTRAAATSLLSAQQSILGTMRSIMTGPQAMLSPEAAYNQSSSSFTAAMARFNSAQNDKDRAAALNALSPAATALLDASKGYFGSSQGYQTDLQIVLKALGGTVGMENPTLSATERLIDTMDKLTTAITDGNRDAMTSLVGSVGPMLAAALKAFMTATTPGTVGSLTSSTPGTSVGGVPIVIPQTTYSTISNINMPSFADGGYHAGGWRLVGERGPELEFTGAARIVSAAETRRALAAGNEELVAELKALRQEVAELKGHAAANVRVGQAGFSQLIAHAESSNKNSAEMASAARRQAA